MCSRRHDQNQDEQAACHSPRRRSHNLMGAWGFGISLFGLLFTFGLLCPLGFLISFFGMFSPKRGLAMAGLILGGLGSLFVAAGIGTLAIAANTFHHYRVEVPKIAKTHDVLNTACVEIETYRQENGNLPEGIEGNKLVLKFEDAFGNSVRYEPEDNGNYGIRSAGLDGKFDTDDDLRVLNSQEGLVHQIATQNRASYHSPRHDSYRGHSHQQHSHQLTCRW